MIISDPKGESLPHTIRQLERKIQEKKRLERLEPNDNVVIDTRRFEEIQSIKLELLLLDNECYSLKKFYLLIGSNKRQVKKRSKKNQNLVTNTST